MDIPSTGRMFHTASQVFGTTSSSISATALVPASSKTIFLMVLLHLLDDEVLLAAVDHVFARLREALQPGGHVREEVDVLWPSRPLRPRVSVIDDAELRSPRRAMW